MVVRGVLRESYRVTRQSDRPSGSLIKGGTGWHEVKETANLDKFSQLQFQMYEVETDYEVNRL